jgi:hypothetical protein
VAFAGRGVHAAFAVDVGALVESGITSVAAVDQGLQFDLVPAREKVTMQSLAGRIALREHKGLRALTRSPQMGKGRCIPVYLDEDVRDMDPTHWAVLTLLGTSAARIGRVGMRVSQIAIWVVARREVEVVAERSSIPVAVRIRKANSMAARLWVWDAHARRGASLTRIHRRASCATEKLNRLDCAFPSVDVQ